MRNLKLSALQHDARNKLRRMLWPVVITGFVGLAHGLTQAKETLQTTRVAPGVYVILGERGEATPQNLGRVVNTGFIVGTDGVVVIDSGANKRHGEAILSTIHATTDKPVKLLIDTHPNPNYVLGNAAFGERGIPILSTAATAAAMLERCTRCIENLTSSIGKEAMEGTRITQPVEHIQSSHTIKIAGRNIALLHFGHARTEGDLAVLDEDSGVLFAGDLVYHEQIQHFAEARFSGWISTLDQLEKYPIKIIVPGRGAVGAMGDLSMLVRMRAYLQQLYTVVGDAYRDGLSPDETLSTAELPEFAHLPGYSKNHPLNVQRAYFEHEADELARTVGRN
jgi:glyoxylase-like metal-dependent hydrolase (beta-lactamase superfamily II)